MLSWVSSYFNNRDQLLHYWLPTAYAMRDHVEAIIVDDHSQEHRAIDVFEESGFDFDLSIYHVDEDLGFNSHGARNLGVQQASHDKILLTDMDKTLGTTGLLNCYLYALERGEYYRLLNWNKRDGFRPSNNNFLLHRQDFLEVEGYDEGFTGCYTGDSAFRRNLQRVAVEKVNDHFLCYCTERENPDWHKTKNVPYNPAATFINFKWSKQV